MKPDSTSLIIKRSQLPKAGKGLFTKTVVKKGEHIVEYLGNITTWQALDHDEGRNGYVFYVTRNYVIDARNTPEHLARYANDANGLTKVAGLRNNAEYVKVGKKVYIKAIRNIKAGAEIFVDYGKEYWDVMKYNKSIA
jgi:uncharacterized protein